MPKTNSLFVDTSGWIAHINVQDRFHLEAAEVLRRVTVAGRGLVTTNYVIAELVALLTSRTRLSRPQVITSIDDIKALPHLEIIHITPLLDDAAWALLKARPDKEWSLVDAASFVVMRDYGMTESLTTDKHFTQAGFVRLPAPSAP